MYLLDITCNIGSKLKVRGGGVRLTYNHPHSIPPGSDGYAGGYRLNFYQFFFSLIKISRHLALILLSSLMCHFRKAG